MADTAPHTTSPANGAPAESPRESIDQVRDLLFGSQMRTVDASIKSLDDRLQALGAELKEQLDRLEKRHLSLQESAGNADAELRDHLAKQNATLSGELAKTSERISSELQRITTDLQAEKLDTSAIVAGLTELAARLGRSARAGKQAPHS